MIKSIEEIKTITVRSNKLFCDICDKMINNEELLIGVGINIVRRDDTCFNPKQSDLLVCSVECLQNPALGLLLNTKKIPEAITGFAEFKKQYSAEKCEEYSPISTKSYNYH